MMAINLPVGIEPGHIRGRGRQPVGAGALVILSAMIAASFSGWLGGTPSPTRSILNPTVLLSVIQPEVLRSGMFFETRIELTAREPIQDATITMTAPLWKSITINTVIPQASEETFSRGSYRLHYGQLDAGDTISVKLDGQINPDLVGGTRGIISASDGDRVLATIPVALRVLP